MSGRKSFVLTIVGTDHPGIVGRLSTLLLDHKANWRQSRMANLAGQFAGILHADVDAQQFSALCADLEKLDSEGLQTIVRATSTGGTAMVEFRQLELEVVGTDRPGIIHDISDVLMRHEINMEEVSTEFSEAPMSSAPMFRATAQLTAARNIDLEDVQAEIEQIAHDLIIDLHLKTNSD